MIDPTSAAKALSALAATPRPKHCAACGREFMARGRGRYCPDDGCRKARGRERARKLRAERRSA